MSGHFSRVIFIALKILIYFLCFDFEKGDIEKVTFGLLVSRGKKNEKKRKQPLDCYKKKHFCKIH